MTLHIRIRDCSNLPSDEGYLFIEGSQAGLLMSNKIQSKNYVFDPPFKIACSNIDILTIKHCKDKEAYSEGITYASAKLFSPVVIKKYEKELSFDNPIECMFVANVDELCLFDEKDKDGGTLMCMIDYDPVMQFQGEISAGLERNQGIKQKFFKGRCPTRNLFSYFDAEAEGQEYKWIESIYMDED